MNRAHKLTVVCSVLLLIGCSDSSGDEPWRSMVEYRWDNFDNRNIAKIEEIMVRFSDQYDLELFQKDKELLDYVTDGKAAFYNTMDYKNHTVVSATNVGVAYVLSVNFHDYGDYSEDRLKALEKEVIQAVDCVVEGSPDRLIHYGDKRRVSGSIFLEN